MQPYKLVIEPSQNTLQTCLWRVNRTTGERVLVQSADSITVAKTKRRIYCGGFYSSFCEICKREYPPIFKHQRSCNSCHAAWQRQLVAKADKARTKPVQEAKAQSLKNLLAQLDLDLKERPLTFLEIQAAKAVECVCHTCTAFYKDTIKTSICDQCLTKAAKERKAK